MKSTDFSARFDGTAVVLTMAVVAVAEHHAGLRATTLPPTAQITLPD